MSERRGGSPLPQHALPAVWDLNPGYLPTRLLLTEHRAIHARLAFLARRQTAEELSSNQPGRFLCRRHGLIISELNLRGVEYTGPVSLSGRRDAARPADISAARQFFVLRRALLDEETGRIPLPHSSQELWEQHRFSVMARDPEYYRGIGVHLERQGGAKLFETLSADFALLLVEQPHPDHLPETLSLMAENLPADARPDSDDPRELMDAIRLHAKDITPLLDATALCDLDAWIPRES